MLPSEYSELALSVEKEPDEENLGRLKSRAPFVISLMQEMSSLAARADAMKRYIYYKDDESNASLGFASLPCNERMGEKLAALGRDMHAVIGLISEIGEVCDAVLDHVYRGRDLDTVNIGEECGDLCWYVNLLATCQGVTLDSVLSTNINKLTKKRFKNGYSDEAAVSRDLVEEREALEEGLNESRDHGEEMGDQVSEDETSGGVRSAVNPEQADSDQQEP